MEHQSEGGDTANASPGASADAVAELGEHHSGQVRIAYRLARAYFGIAAVRLRDRLALLGRQALGSR